MSWFFFKRIVLHNFLSGHKFQPGCYEFCNVLVICSSFLIAFVFGLLINFGLPFINIP